MSISPKKVRESRTIKSSHVLPPDTNNHGTLFGGKLMAYIDDVAAIAATRHARKYVVTASSDSVDFLHPIKEGYSVCLEAFVSWSHRTSMEVFVKVVSENLLTGDRELCALSFLTFVAIDEDGKPTPVPGVIPETEEEKGLFEGAAKRAERRRKRRDESKQLAQNFGTQKPWE
ncbi:acyl-CoA thioesterase [Alkalihalobacillus sp. AL-G]|uniref:acyl-CoA thioesterase n=1 Tax=Alkalihalobacillus sp. AL-G TaxID=2926399 RepID=UPI00272A0CDB|nr:acyl-CoA thioesterase [Alkalihalobacillus sp. AL-G]WLD91552.1 acyl-CoA thioesterase [Alkalihalobacillus sp. AL-G]